MSTKKPRKARNQKKNQTTVITSREEVVQVYRKKDTTTGSALGDSQVMSDGNNSFLMNSQNDAGSKNGDGNMMFGEEMGAQFEEEEKKSGSFSARGSQTMKLDSKREGKASADKFERLLDDLNNQSQEGTQGGDIPE